MFELCCPLGQNLFLEWRDLPSWMTELGHTMIPLLDLHQKLGRATLKLRSYPAFYQLPNHAHVAASTRQSHARPHSISRSARRLLWRARQQHKARSGALALCSLRGCIFGSHRFCRWQGPCANWKFLGREYSRSTRSISKVCSAEPACRLSMTTQGTVFLIFLMSFKGNADSAYIKQGHWNLWSSKYGHGNPKSLLTEKMFSWQSSTVNIVDYPLHQIQRSRLKAKDSVGKDFLLLDILVAEFWDKRFWHIIGYLSQRSEAGVAHETHPIGWSIVFAMPSLLGFTGTQGATHVDCAFSKHWVATYMYRYNVFIEREAFFTARQCLVALPGTKKDGMKRVLSNTIGLDQCDQYLQAMAGICREAVADTAEAARVVAESGDM